MNKAKIFFMLTAIAVVFSVWASPADAQSKMKNQSGSVYIQTNGIANEIIHYGRQADGKLVEIANFNRRCRFGNFQTDNRTSKCAECL